MDSAKDHGQAAAEEARKAGANAAEAGKQKLGEAGEAIQEKRENSAQKDKRLSTPLTKRKRR